MTRGCGERVLGGVYATLDLSPFGVPWSTFLVDPPEPQDLKDLGISAVGTHFIERPDKGFHLFDVVGRDAYPNVADFVMEALRMGISRRLSKRLDWTKIDSETRLVLIHERAFQVNYEEMYGELQSRNIPITCPKRLPHHCWSNMTDAGELQPPIQQCLGLCWHDVDGGEPVDANEWLSDSDLTVRRNFPPDNVQLSYLAMRRPSTHKPFYAPAIFMSVPFRLVVVQDPDDKERVHELAKTIAQSTSIPVSVEKQ